MSPVRNILLVVTALAAATSAVAQPAPDAAGSGPAARRVPGASPRYFLDNAWAVGASYTMGLAGAEWLRVAGRHAALGLGVGATGVGARALWYPGDRYDAMFWRWYLSSGVGYGLAVRRSRPRQRPRRRRDRVAALVPRE
ncbi:MAG TPA: hypothetical protein VFY92_09165 [Hyphomicrobiaceae bacterium]|jgi:hypothetical protein|nr:hypothetical protein [Hyphomicrobiaceae bacterium]